MTREAMIEGFRTMGEAVNGVGATVDRSMASLERTLHGLSSKRD